MLEELKMILDSIGDLTGVALWVVGFFIMLKLIIYLSTTGAIVFLAKLGIERLHTYVMKLADRPVTKVEKVIKNEVIERPVVVKGNGFTAKIMESASNQVAEVLSLCVKPGSDTHYIHQSDLKWAADVLRHAQTYHQD